MHFCAPDPLAYHATSVLPVGVHRAVAQTFHRVQTGRLCILDDSSEEVAPPRAPISKLVFPAVSAGMLQAPDELPSQGRCVGRATAVAPPRCRRGCSRPAGAVRCVDEIRRAAAKALREEERCAAAGCEFATGVGGHLSSGELLPEERRWRLTLALWHFAPRPSALRPSWDMS